MRLLFLGTKANIPISSPEHAYHSALLVEASGTRVMVDCGADWLGRHPPDIDAIILTHAHPDHADGLRRGADCPVFATQSTWDSFRRRVRLDRRLLDTASATPVCSLDVAAVPIRHSLRAPAVALVIGHRGSRFAYAPDVLSLPDPAAVLGGISLYVGDGSALRRSIVRGRDEERVGHASIQEQLRWCAEYHVLRALFTHCGQQLLRLGYEQSNATVRAMGVALGVDAHTARDGMELRL